MQSWPGGGAAAVTATTTASVAGHSTVVVSLTEGKYYLTMLKKLYVTLLQHSYFKYLTIYLNAMTALYDY